MTETWGPPEPPKPPKQTPGRGGASSTIVAVVLSVAVGCLIGVFVTWFVMRGDEGATAEPAPSMQPIVTVPETTTTSTTTQPPTTTIPMQHVRGSFQLLADPGGEWDDCYGLDGYEDFRSGQDVTFRVASGEIVAVTTARNVNLGDMSSSDPWLAAAATRAAGASLSCILVFDTDLPLADFYTVEIGRRGDISYSRADLEATDWTVELTLG